MSVLVLLPPDNIRLQTQRAASHRGSRLDLCIKERFDFIIVPDQPPNSPHTMALIRATGLFAQALFNHLAATPPSPKVPASSTASPAPKSLESTKYHTEDWWIFRIAPAMFQVRPSFA